MNPLNVSIALPKIVILLTQGFWRNVLGERHSAELRQKGMDEKESGKYFLQTVISLSY